jgi:hypothetical protein
MVQAQAWAFHRHRACRSPHLAPHGLPGTLDAAHIVDPFVSALMRFAIRP